MTHTRATGRLAPIPPEAVEMLHLARENLRLLTALAARFEVARLDEPADPPTLMSPAAVAAYLQPELADLAQEPLRVVLLDTRYRLLGIQLVFQGGVNATAIRLADCFREAVARGAIGLILVHNHPSGAPRSA